jgi:SAM-dependent methyltransferase
MLSRLARRRRAIASRKPRLPPEFCLTAISMPGGETPYTRSYFATQSEWSAQAARIIIPELMRLIDSARSALDVGCGVGTWLEELAGHGVTEILGVDGEYVPAEYMRIPADRFRVHDLREPLNLDRRFELVVCLEVGEHLPEAAAATLVESLVAHGDVVLFSAAIPYQGGAGHVNEQWPSYWAGLFRRHRLEPHDLIRPLIWTDRRIAIHYRQNTILYAPPGRLPRTTTGPIDLVHPEHLELVERERVRRQLSLREIVGGIPAAVRATVSRRVKGGSEAH